MSGLHYYCWVATCSGPQTLSCSLASLAPLNAATHISHGREDAGDAVMYPVNAIEVRIWLQILPDLHWLLVERWWEGNNEALAKPRGLISAPHRHNFPDVQRPEVLLSARLAVVQPPEEGEKLSAKQSPSKKGLPPLPDEQPGSGMGAGVEDRGLTNALLS